MVSDRHTFSVWHPSWGVPAVARKTEFKFTAPVSRTTARYQVEKVEGYVIEKQPRPARKGPYIHKPRPRVAKIR